MDKTKRSRLRVIESVCAVINQLESIEDAHCLQLFTTNPMFRVAPDKFKGTSRDILEWHNIILSNLSEKITNVFEEWSKIILPIILSIYMKADSPLTVNVINTFIEKLKGCTVDDAISLLSSNTTTVARRYYSLLNAIYDIDYETLDTINCKNEEIASFARVISDRFKTYIKPYMVKEFIIYFKMNIHSNTTNFSDMITDENALRIVKQVLNAPSKITSNKCFTPCILDIFYFVERYLVDKPDIYEKLATLFVKRNGVLEGDSLTIASMTNILTERTEQRLMSKAGYPESAAKQFTVEAKRLLFIFHILAKRRDETLEYWFKNITINDLKDVVTTLADRIIVGSKVTRSEYHVHFLSRRISTLKYTLRALSDYIDNYSTKFGEFDFTTLIKLVEDPVYKKCELHQLIYEDSSETPEINIENIIPLSTDDLEALYNASNNLSTSHTLLISILTELGLRRSAVSFLKWQSLVDSNNQIKVGSCYVPEKQGATREFPITPKLREALSAHMNATSFNLGDYIFVSKSTGKPSLSLCVTMLKQIIREIPEGIDKKIYPHLFRHTIVTNYIEKGANIADVSKFMGHKSIITTLGSYFKGNIHERLKREIVRSNMDNRLYVMEVFNMLLQGAARDITVNEAVDSLTKYS